MAIEMGKHETELKNSVKLRTYKQFKNTAKQPKIIHSTNTEWYITFES